VIVGSGVLGGAGDGGDEEAVEDGAADRIVGGAFGVPLDGEEEGVAWAFYGFDDAVGGDGGGEEALAQAVDALVVGAGDVDAFGEEPVGEPALGVEGDGVLGGAGVAGAVVKNIFIGGQVLVEGAAMGNVDKLSAEADA